MQEYRYGVLSRVAEIVAKAMDVFGIRRPIQFKISEPVPAGDYDHALHVDHPEAPSLLEQYLQKPEPKLGGKPKETSAPLPPTH
jgi:hypothetical protein